jgi:hypothetical protein
VGKKVEGGQSAAGREALIDAAIVLSLTAEPFEEAVFAVDDATVAPQASAFAKPQPSTVDIEELESTDQP